MSVKSFDYLMKKIKQAKENYVPPKKRIHTEVIMRMAHFHDFYYLQAMIADLTMRKAGNEELIFSKSVEKLEEKLEETCEYVFPNMALRVFMYLYAACLGEARHANDSLAETRFIESTVKQQRVSIFDHIAEYPPTNENLQAIINVFDQDWRSGYGGKAWLEIAKALPTYLTLGAATFIDHVVDLEHNNGTVFSKPDGHDSIHFDIRYKGRFGNFLNYKFEENILKKAHYDVLELSPRVYNLLERYCNVFHEKMPNWVSKELENLDDYTVEWGEEKIHCVEKWYKWVGVQTGNVPTVEKLWELAEFEQISVSHCKKSEVMKHLAKSKKLAYKIAGKFLNTSLKKGLKLKIEEFVCENENRFKNENIKEFYKILPIKVRRSGNELVFQVPAQFFGIGEKTDYGFSYTEQNHGIYLPAGNSLGFDGEPDYHSGYLMKEYGETVIYIGRERFMYTTKLEALLD